MPETILPKYISIILKKAIAAILAVAFLFNDIAFAGDFQNLAPKSSLTIVEFKERFAKGYDVLRHEAFNGYIAKYIASRVKNIGLDKVKKEDIDGIGKVDITQFLETRTDVVRVDIDGMKVWQDILIAAVPDLFANRGQFAGVGLGRWNGMPVIYVDKLFYYDESKIRSAKDEIPIEDKRAVINHDKKETAKWIRWKWMREDLARQWGCVVRGDFRDLWIKGNPGAKEAAYAFHKDSGSLNHLFHKYKHLLDWEELYRAYLESGSIFDSEDTGPGGDVNIAAGAKPASTFIRETREKSYLAADAENVIRNAAGNILPHEVDGKPLKVLDLMSGHNTYLADSINVGEIAGIGLNIEELKGNKKITHPLVQDLNKNPKLPFEGNRFDAVTITCGMAYMREPRRLFKEIYRVLKPGGTLFIAFNDQYYEADVTAEWRELSQNGMVEITKRWVASGGAFEPIKHERKFYTIGSGSYTAKRLLDIIATRKPASYVPVTTSPAGGKNNFLNAGAADITIAGNGWKGKTREEHDLYHGNLDHQMRIITDALKRKLKANKLGIVVGRHPHRGNVQHSDIMETMIAIRNKTGEGEIVLDNIDEGAVKITLEDGIVIIINPNFSVNHAGRNDMTVYARDERGAVHEKTELALWRDHAMNPVNGIVPRGLIRDKETAYMFQLGDRIMDWANRKLKGRMPVDNRAQAEELRRRFHRLACRAELEYILKNKNKALADLILKKFMLPAVEYLMDKGMDIDIVETGSEASDEGLLTVEPGKKRLVISKACLESHSAQWFEYRITTCVRYRELLGDYSHVEDRLAAEIEAERRAMLEIYLRYRAREKTGEYFQRDVMDDLKKVGDPGRHWDINQTLRVFNLVKERFSRKPLSGDDRRTLNSIPDNFVFGRAFDDMSAKLSKLLRDETAKSLKVHSDKELADPFIESKNKGPEERAGEPNIIPENSALAALGRAAKVNFYVPASMRKDGFWQYELNLSSAERDSVHANIIPAYKRDDKSQPSKIRIIFHDDSPVLITSDDLAWSQIPENLRNKNEEHFIGLKVKAYLHTGMRETLARKKAERDFAKHVADKSVCLGYDAFPASTKADIELLKRAMAWVEKNSKSINTHTHNLFVTHKTVTGFDMLSFPQVYSPNSYSSRLFASGVWPKKSSKLLVLGTGSGIDALAAAERTKGDVSILATDINDFALECSKFNAARSQYGYVIEFAKADLFDMPGRPAREKFDSILFNVLLEPAGEVDKDTNKFDPGGVLLKRLLPEARDHLNPGGTLEMNYRETPRFLSSAYEAGWEPVIIEGTNQTRRELPEHLFDYVRFTLVRREARGRSQDVFEELKMDWRTLAEIDNNTKDRYLDGSERAAAKTFMAKYKERNDFDSKLIYKAAYTLFIKNESLSQRLPVDEVRSNELYPEYMQYRYDAYPDEWHAPSSAVQASDAILPITDLIGNKLTVKTNLSHGEAYKNTGMTLDNVMRPYNALITIASPDTLIIGGVPAEAEYFLRKYPQGNVTDVDITMSQLTTLRDSFAAVPKIEDRLRLYRADAASLDRNTFPNASFDCVYAMGMTIAAFDTPQDRQTNLSGIASEEVRLLRPGGVLFHPMYLFDAMSYYKKYIRDGYLELVGPMASSIDVYRRTAKPWPATPRSAKRPEDGIGGVSRHNYMEDAPLPSPLPDEHGNANPTGSVTRPSQQEPEDSAAAAREKEALHKLLEKIGLRYADTWYEDIKALPEVRKAYKGDLSVFVRAVEDNLDHPRTIISLAYSALMRYLEHPSTTNLGRHGWMIEDLRQRFPGIIEKKLASQDPKEKALTIWDLGCGYLEPVLIASVILEEFDKHKEWGEPGEKIKVLIKAVDVDQDTSGKIDTVLEDGFPYDAENVLLGKRVTPPVVKDLIRKYIGFVHKKENRRRIKELGLIEFVRESVTHKDQVLNPAVESGDILYMSYVLWELTEEARAQVLERLKYIKKGALVYIRDVDSINIGGMLAGIGIKTTPLYTAETDVQHSSTTHVLIEGEKPRLGHTDTTLAKGAPAAVGVALNGPFPEAPRGLSAPAMQKIPAINSPAIIERWIEEKRLLMDPMEERPVWIAIDGDKGVGKTLYACFLQSVLGIPVIHLDEWIDHDAETKSWERLAEKMKQMSAELKVPAILVEGYHLLNAENRNGIHFDLKLKVVTTPNQRRQNVFERIRREWSEFSDTDVNRQLLVRQEYLHSPQYDAEILNSYANRPEHVEMLLERIVRDESRIGRQRASANFLKLTHHLVDVLKEYLENDLIPLNLRSEMPLWSGKGRVHKVHIEYFAQVISLDELKDDHAKRDAYFDSLLNFYILLDEQGRKLDLPVQAIFAPLKRMLSQLYHDDIKQLTLETLDEIDKNMRWCLEKNRDSAEPTGGSQKPYKPFGPKNLMPDEEPPTPLPDFDGTVKVTGPVGRPQPGKPIEISSEETWKFAESIYGLKHLLNPAAEFIIQLHYSEGKTIAEIAETLGKGEATINALVANINRNLYKRNKVLVDFRIGKKMVSPGFGERLLRIEAALGMSSRELGSMLGVNPATVSGWVNGKRLPQSYNKIARFAAENGIPLEYILKGEKEDVAFANVRRQIGKGRSAKRPDGKHNYKPERADPNAKLPSPLPDEDGFANPTDALIRLPSPAESAAAAAKQSSLRESDSGKMGQSPPPLYDRPGTVPIFPTDNTIRAANPAELLMVIREDDGPGGLLAKALGEGFSVNDDLCPRMSPYRDKRLVNKAYYNLVKPLIDVGIFVRIDGRVKFSDMMIDMRGRTREHAKNLINVVNNVKLKIGSGGDKLVLRGSIQPEMRTLAREAIRLHIVDYAYKKASLAEKPYTIKAWEGYAAVSQKPFLTKIRDLTDGKVSFEDDIDELVSFACKNVNDSTVTILPLKLLSREQIEALETHKARVIYINLDGEHVESDDLTNLEGLIGVGRAYLNNDDESFYRLYRLLTLQPASYVPLKELKDNPADFIKRLNFTLKPITPYDSNERARIRHYQEALLRAA